ncbi:MAG: hypothetical protein J7578_04365 [Chitinophagaceae bacterium]|nr:hypothetical protein [Chitinophagaceae bacterium]
MKTIVLAVCLLVMSMLQVNAQSIHSNKARVKYTIKPTIDKKFSNCSGQLIVSAINFDEYGITPETEKSYQNMTAWNLNLKPVPNAGDLHLKIYIGSPEYGSAIRDVSFSRKAVPPPSGQMTSNQSNFYARYNLYLPFRVEAYDKDGNKLLEKIFDTITSHESPLLGTDNEERGQIAFEKGRRSYLYGDTKNMISAHMSEFIRIMKRKLMGESGTSPCWFHGFKKAEKYNLQAYNEWAEKAIDSLEKVAIEGSPERNRQALEGAIQFWTSEYDSIKEATDELGQDKKYICAYNLAHAYSWTGNEADSKKFLAICYTAKSIRRSVTDYLVLCIKDRE